MTRRLVAAMLSYRTVTRKSLFSFLFFFFDRVRLVHSKLNRRVVVVVLREKHGDVIIIVLGADAFIRYPIPTSGR